MMEMRLMMMDALLIVRVLSLTIFELEEACHPLTLERSEKLDSILILLRMLEKHTVEMD